MTRRAGNFVLIALALSLTLVLLSPLASSHPDGLERVVEDHAGGHEGEPGHGPMPEYLVPGISAESASTILAGLVGTLAVFAAGWGLARLTGRRRAAGAQDARVETPASR